MSITSRSSITRTYSRRGSSTPALEDNRVEDAPDAPAFSRLFRPPSQLIDVPSNEAKHGDYSCDLVDLKTLGTQSSMATAFKKRPPDASVLPLLPPGQRTVTDYFKRQCTQKLPPTPATSQSSCHGSRRLPSLPIKRKEQLFLDLGQRAIGPIACPACGMSYSRGVPEDESVHAVFHKRQVSGIHISQWPSATVASTFVSRLKKPVLVLRIPPMPSHLAKKAETVIDLAQRELGAVRLEYSFFDIDGRATFLAIDESTKRVLGAVLVETINSSYLASIKSQSQNSSDDDDTPSEVIIVSAIAQPALIGISRVWVARQARRQGIAHGMLDAMLKAMSKSLDTPLTKQDVAFSAPTTSGAFLAQSWTLRQAFKVYSGN